MVVIRRNLPFFAVLFFVIAVALVGRAYLPRLLATPAPPRLATPAVPSVSIEDLKAIADRANSEVWVVAEVRDERVPDDVRRYLGVREEILLLVYGKVEAGFDPTTLESDALWTGDHRAQLHLPAPSIRDIEVDFDRSRVVHHTTSPLLGSDPELRSRAMEAAIDALNQAALEAGVLEQAARYGQLFYENHLRSLGFTEVRVAVN